MAHRDPAADPAFDFRRAMADPSAYFSQPRDVLARRGLAYATKLRLLQVWEEDARRLAVADDEGMSGGEESMHGRVLAALQQLNAERPGSTGLDPMALLCQAKGMVDAAIKATRERPVAGLLAAAVLGYVIGRVRPRD